jgi:hypothetical protein
MTIWYVLYSFGTFFTVLVSRSNKNLATLPTTRNRSEKSDSTSEAPFIFHMKDAKVDLELFLSFTLSLSICFCLSFYVFLSFSLYLSFFLSFSLSVSRLIYACSSISLSFYISHSLSLFLFQLFSIYMFLCLNLALSLSLFHSVSVSISISLLFHFFGQRKNFFIGMLFLPGQFLHRISDRISIK